MQEIFEVGGGVERLQIVYDKPNIFIRILNVSDNRWQEFCFEPSRNEMQYKLFVRFVDFLEQFTGRK